MFQVTNTDGEQQDDSLDLIDGLPEMSPPPTSNHLQNNSSHSNNHYSMANSTHVENGTRNNNNNTNATKNAQYSTAPKTQTPSLNNVPNGPGPPPPTPMVGSHQEPRFTFVSGRPPLLPDLRTADFFR